MATAIDAENWSDDKDARCCICANENKNEIADYYCYDCNKHLCTSCLGIHNKFIAYHKVVQGLGDGKDVLTEKCEKHADEVITLYCRQHEELLCRKCHLLDHRKCQDPQNIRECSDELNADPELQTVTAQLQSALDNIDKTIEALDKHVTNIQKCGKGFLKDLEDYAEKLLARIEELKEKGKQDIKSKQKQLLSVARQHRHACEVAKDEINQCLVKLAKSKKWKASMFVFQKKGQAIAQKADFVFNKSDSLIKGRQFSFMTDMKIFDSLNCFHSLIEEGTRVKVYRAQSSVGCIFDIPVQAIVRSPGKCQVGKPVEKRGDVPVVKHEKKQINVRIPEDKHMCDNMGFCHLSDGTLIVADWKNERLKRVDPSSSNVTKYCDTDGSPTDVCCIGPQEVAVAINSTIVHVYNTVSMTRTRTVELGHDAYRIACHGGLLYSSTLGGDILYVHDVNSGRKLREISKNTDRLELFSKIKRIAVNSSGDRVYVADAWRGLVCVGADGRPIFHLSKEDLGLSFAYGVTTDHRGHVFVCGLISNNVVMVTEDGHVVGQILSEEDGITWSPECLSYDLSRSQLYVGAEIIKGQLLVVELKS